MYSGLATTILCAKFLSSPIVQSEFLMGKTSRSPDCLHYAKKHTFEHILGGYDYTETVAEDPRFMMQPSLELYDMCKYATPSFGYANALYYMTEVSAGYGWKKTDQKHHIF